MSGRTNFSPAFKFEASNLIQHLIDKPSQLAPKYLGRQIFKKKTSRRLKGIMQDLLLVASLNKNLTQIISTSSIFYKMTCLVGHFNIRVEPFAVLNSLI